MMRIKIILENLEFTANLYDTPTAKAILENLPLKGNAHRWGDEIYFTAPLSVPLEPDAREIVENGELGFWPVGSAFCIFFGKTPVSTTSKPQAYSPVNVFGKMEGDLSELKSVAPGMKIKIRNS